MTIELLSHNLRKRKLNSVGQRTRSPDSHQMEKKNYKLIKILSPPLDGHQIVIGLKPLTPFGI
jgi:hypothetical protein